MLADLVVNGVGVAAEVENVGDGNDTGDCVTSDDGEDPCPVEKVVGEVVTSTENCPVDMAVDCDEVVTSTETCPVEIVVG